MAKRKTRSAAKKSNGATVGYEAQLWQMADALRGSMDAAEYKHGYPPDKQEKATHTVLEQAAVLSAEWAVA